MQTPQVTVTVLGVGCRCCRNTYALVEEVARTAGVPIALTRADDPQQFIAYGVMRPPAVVIDGRLVHACGMPSRAAVEGWLRTEPMS